MKKNMKLFAFDLDGTFLTEKDSHLKESAKALEEIKKAGDISAVVTGRPLHSTKKIENLEKMFDHIIVSDGSYAYETKEEKEHWAKFIEEEYIRRATELAKKYYAVLWIHQGKKTLRYKTIKEETDFEKWGIKHGWFKKGDVKHISQFTSDAQLNGPHQMWIRVENIDDGKALTKELKKLPFKITIDYHEPHYIIMSPDRTNKYYGAIDLAKRLGIKKKNIYAFGDGINDISMVKGIKNSYAMGNGHELVKKHAKKIVGTNKETTIYDEVMKILNDTKA